MEVKLPDIGLLRAERARRGIPLKDIARALNKHVSYLSHIERGRRPASSSILQAYAKLLGNNDLLNLSNDFQTARDAIEIIQFIRPYWRGILPISSASKEQELIRSWVHQYSKQCERKDTDLAAFFEAALTLSPQPENSIHIFLDNNTSQYCGFIKQCLSRVILKCVQNSVPIDFLLVPSKNVHTSLKQTLLLLKLNLGCVNFRSLASFDAAGDAQFVSGIPADFFILHPTFAVQRFAIDDITHDEGVVTSGNVSALTKLYRRIRADRERRVSIFLGESELSRFFDAYITSDTFYGPRVIAQRFLGSLTRPLGDFENGTNWYRWYQERKVADIDVFAQGRLRTTIAFRNRLHIYPFRQICSSQSLRQWAETGERDDVRSTYLRECASDRRARIKNVLFLLDKFEKFDIAVIDDSVGERFGWSIGTERRNVSWTVDGRERFIFETSVNNEDDSGAGGIQELHGIVTHAGLAHTFMEYFDYEWIQLRQHQDKKKVIGFFEDLYDKVK